VNCWVYRMWMGAPFLWGQWKRQSRLHRLQYNSTVNRVAHLPQHAERGVRLWARCGSALRRECGCGETKAKATLTGTATSRWRQSRHQGALSTCAHAHMPPNLRAQPHRHTHMHTQPTHAHPTPGSACMTANTQTYWHINCSKRAPGVLVVPERLHRHKVVQECPPGLRVLHHMRPAHAQLLQGRTPGPLLLLQTRCWWARPERDLVLSKEGFEGLPQKEQRSVDPKKAMLSSLWFKRHPHKGAHASHSVQVNGGPRAEPVCQHIVYSTICNTI